MSDFFQELKEHRRRTQEKVRIVNRLIGGGCLLITAIAQLDCTYFALIMGGIMLVFDAGISIINLLDRE